MNGNEPALLVCNPENAKEFIEKDPNVKGALVTTKVICKGCVVVVPKQEFLDMAQRINDRPDTDLEEDSAVIICGPSSAEFFRTIDKNTDDILVVSEAVSKEIAAVMGRQEFLDWLTEAKTDTEENSGEEE